MSYTVNALERIFIRAGKEKEKADFQHRVNLKRLEASGARLELATENELEAQSALTKVRALDGK